MTAKLKIVRETHRPVIVEPKKRKLPALPRESLKQIAARIAKGKPPRRPMVVRELKRSNDEVWI